ncbi:hypothetical protein [Paenibacillus piri]|nr:hypothetical protein [Paenibacillus piri]
MNMNREKRYASPRVIRHERILFETTISCPGGHLELQPTDDFWIIVCVKD